MPEAQFPRRPLLGSSVNRGTSPLSYFRAGKIILSVEAVTLRYLLRCPVAMRVKNVDISAKEEGALLEAGFEPLENRLLWEKNGVWYGRQAALQKALRKLREEDGVYLFDRT